MLRGRLLAPSALLHRSPARQQCSLAHIRELQAIERMKTSRPSPVRGSSTGVPTAGPQARSDDHWRKVLSWEEYDVLREKGTERAWSGIYNDHFPKDGGVYCCAGCQTPLYTAASKFESGCGWPAFDKCLAGAVSTTIDTSWGMRRVEITCAACGGHLGHVFEGEHATETNQRHCVNSVSIVYVEGNDVHACAPEGLAEETTLDLE